ncbi:putative diphthamide synthesis protein [Nakaseomyces glabratus]|nr:putative diphthamide synthesis protein [Nakaseomyces glabratus]KAH7603751.1 putative diphthamide synthesis protein [Nakaseomyces glabratus]
MSNEDILVPAALSTHQDESDFTFQKFDSDSMERSFYLGPLSSQDELWDKLMQYYSIDKLIAYLQRNPEYVQITLQFPDTLVKDSSFIIRALQDKLDGDGAGRKFWALADTAYSACCVDEVAAEHVKGDLVIHFGDACLNAIQKLPVVYDFGKPFLDTDVLLACFTEEFKDKDQKICLMSNASYTHHIPDLYSRLKSNGYTNVVYSVVNTGLLTETTEIIDNTTPLSDTDELFTLGNRVLMGARQEEDIDEETLRNEYALFHITMPHDPHLLYLTTVFESIHTYDVADQVISNGPYPSLTRRYKNMHKARTAGCIGILVNTLSIRGTRETVNKLIKLIRENGKKHYLFVVGKPNVPKLANFEPVDIWCILGCGQSGIIVDEFGEFYKPIITPYELTLALNFEVTWTGKWIIDFQKAITEIDNSLAELGIDDSKHGNDSDHDLDAPEFDAVTGKYVSSSRPLRALNHLQLDAPSNEDKQVMARVNGGTVIKGTVSTAVEHLANRAWTGLGSDYKDDEGYEEDGATVEEGISGIARGYEFDQEDAARKSQNQSQ